MRITTNLVAIVFLVACCSTAQAQRGFRPPPRPRVVNPPRPVPPPKPQLAVRQPTRTTITRPPTVRATAKPPVHRNSAKSNARTHVYGIYATNKSTGTTRAYKYGVGSTGTTSGKRIANRRTGQSSARTYSRRANGQVNRLNRQAVATGKNVRYSSRVLKTYTSQPSGKPTARGLAYSGERQLVTRSTAKGRSLPGNQLPKPHPHSRWHLERRVSH